MSREAHVNVENRISAPKLTIFNLNGTQEANFGARDGSPEKRLPLTACPKHTSRAVRRETAQMQKDKPEIPQQTA
jgi:hypothetical protein